MGLTALLFVSIMSGCCMFWKRAYDDSMPDHVDRQESSKPCVEKQYFQVLLLFIVQLERIPAFGARAYSNMNGLPWFIWLFFMHFVITR